MPKNGEKTKKQILESAKSEFLDKGFQNAHLRVIAKNAGVTTGALYRHFKDKQMLFEALVEPVKNKVISLFKEQSNEYINLLEKEGMDPMWNRQGFNSESLVNFIYDNWDEFKLLACFAEQARSDDFLGTLVEYEVITSIKYLTEAKKFVPNINIPQVEVLQTIAQTQFTAFFELVYQDIPRQKGLEYTKSINNFFVAGWREVILGNK